MRFLSIHDFHRGTDYIFTLVRGKVLRSHMAPTPPLGRIVDRGAAEPRPADCPLQRQRVDIFQPFYFNSSYHPLPCFCSRSISGIKALGISSISPCHRHTFRCEGTLCVCSFLYNRIIKTHRKDTCLVPLFD